MIDYYSDRENGPVARTEDLITPAVWAANRHQVEAFAPQVLSASGKLLIQLRTEALHRSHVAGLGVDVDRLAKTEGHRSVTAHHLNG